MRIYIAALFSSRARLREVRNELEALGHRVTASWLDDETQGPVFEEDRNAWRKSVAIRDMTEIKSSNCIILDTLDPVSDGREVEWGIGLTRMEMKRYIVGPNRSVFHNLAHQSFVGWEQLLRYFSREDTDVTVHRSVESPLA